MTTWSPIQTLGVALSRLGWYIVIRNAARGEMQ